MARSAATAVENSFIKGLLTEATGLNFPENACTETFDCVFNQIGQASRRKGIDIETDAETKSYTGTDGVVREYVWRVAGNTGAITFLVVQYGSTIHFYSISGTTLSANLESFSIDLLDYDTTTTFDTSELACEFSSGNGLLFIAHPQVEPLMVEYDPDTNDITVTELNLKVRDFAGLDDGLEIDERPATLSNEHEYNLKNQGWYPATVFKIDVNNTGATNANPITHFESVVGDYPANNESWWAYKRPRTDTSNTTYQEVFDPETTDWIKIGNTPAPKGHYLLEAFNLDRSTVSGVAGLTTETSGGARPQTVAFFAGRAFWGGCSATKFNTRIYFSQVIERESQVAQCYQSQDPTDEDVPDLLPNDGGVIVIPELRQVVTMLPIADSLFIFATNGVWKVSGSEGIGFRANDYSIIKVSDVPAISALSFVLVENIPVWWNESGIWTLATENGIDFTVRSLTDTTIKDFYDEIPATAKHYAKGAFNTQSKIVQWVYSNTDPATDAAEDTFKYDRILNLNTLTGAFYPWRMTGEDSVLVRGITSLEGITLQQDTEEVFVDTDQVLVTGDEEVVSQAYTQRSVQSQFKYLAHILDGHTTLTEGITFAEEVRTDYTDWVLLGSSDDFESYFDTGYKVYGEGDKLFQSNYVTVNYEAQLAGSVYIQGVWDYATDGDTGRWSSKQQVMNYLENYRHLMAKKKIRGNGRALQLRFSSQSGKPFTLNGWTVFVTGNQIV